nr:MAG TPA: hypothetical protein [Caudoviricetes sp.]
MYHLIMLDYQTTYSSVCARKSKPCEKFTARELQPISWS